MFRLLAFSKVSFTGAAACAAAGKRRASRAKNEVRFIRMRAGIIMKADPKPGIRRTAKKHSRNGE